MTDSSRPSALAPFRVRSYRFQWPADLFASWAFEMEAIILGWYILVETGSVLLLSLYASLGFVGTLIAPVFGVFGDRIGHRNLLAGMRATYAILALALLTLALTGVLAPLFVFIGATLLGLVRPSDLGVRGALVATTIPHEQLTTAMSVSRTTMDTARMTGALTGAGLFAALGMAPAYVVIVCLYLASTVLTLCVTRPVRTPQPADIARPSPLNDLKEGVVFIWTTPRMQAVMWTAFLVNLTAYPITGGLLPYIAREVFGTDQTGLGYMSASYAVGSLIASIALSMLGAARLGRTMIVATVVWYVSLMLFAQVRSMPLAVLCLATAGFAQSLSMIAVAVILLRAAGERFRGRVMGVRMMAIYGLPIGLLAGGALIERIGYVPTVALYTATGVALIAFIALRWRVDLWPASAPANAG
jgi:MFS family permease